MRLSDTNSTKPLQPVQLQPVLESWTHHQSGDLVGRLTAAGYLPCEIADLTGKEIQEVEQDLQRQDTPVHQLLKSPTTARTQQLAKRLWDGSEFRTAVLRDCIFNSMGVLSAVESLREEDKFKMEMLQSLELLPKASQNIKVQEHHIYEQIVYQLEHGGERGSSLPEPLALGSGEAEEES